MIPFAVREEHREDPWGTRAWHRQRVGREGEQLVRAQLARAGWRLVGARLRLAGIEVDLVVTKGGRVALIEVKTRRSQEARPEEDLAPAQRVRLHRAALVLADRGRQALPVAAQSSLPRRIASVEVWLAACRLAADPGGQHELRFFQCPPAEAD